MTPQRDQILHNLTHYVLHDLLQDPTSALLPSSPLLEWGVLNSMNIAKLMAHIQIEQGVAIPPEELVGKNFKDLNALTDLILRLRPTA